MSVFRRLSEIRQPKADQLIEQTEEGEMGFYLTQTAKGKVVRVTGRLDANTAPILEEHLGRHLIQDSEQKLVFDFRGLEFISSAGLRVCVKAHQKADLMLVMQKKAENPVYRVFDISGVALTLNIEENIDAVM